jgi:hypothetical protein
MRKRLRPAFWIESVMACLTAFLALLSLLTPDWIEVVFGIDPDRHSGSVEWGIVVVCCVAPGVRLLVVLSDSYRHGPGAVKSE